MKNPTGEQVSNAVSLLPLFWSCKGMAPSVFGQKLHEHFSSQKEIIRAAAKEGKLAREHLNILLETPLTSNCALPGFLASAIQNAGSNRAKLSTLVSRFCGSTDTTVRINASFSTILISAHFQPLPRMFQLQRLISTNLAEMQYRGIVEAAADALVELCRETKDQDVATQTFSFLSEQSLLFSPQIEQLRSLPMRISRAPPLKPRGRRRMGTPRKYPEVSRRAKPHGHEAPQKAEHNPPSRPRALGRHQDPKRALLKFN